MSYVLIDRDLLVFRHKHSDPTVVRNLAHLEVAHCHASVVCIDSDIYMDDWTDLELRLLYEHTTGDKLQTYSRKLIVSNVLQAAQALPDTDVDAFEVKIQANKIPFSDKGFYKYVRGSYDPVRFETLFTPEALRSTPPFPALAPLPMLAALPEPAAGGTGHDRLGAGSSARAATATAPRGGVRELVFEYATRAWEAAGSPLDQSVVLKLRKQWMNDLESNHGVKRATASSTLGEWWKARLSNNT